MKLRLTWVVLAVALCGSVRSENPVVTGIKAVCRNGQTFVTWKDAAEGEEAAKFRYSLYRSDGPISQDNVAKAELCFSGVLPNSAKLFGSAFNMKDRLDDKKPTAILEDDGKPLPMWSGLAVRTIEKAGKSYYAVVATDEKLEPLSLVAPGGAATAEPADEKPAPIQPIKLYDSKTRGQYSAQTCVTGTKGLPLMVSLHASSGQGGGASAWGDYYLYFATREMGWRDGLPGVFSVEERRGKPTNTLVLNSRDAIEHPSGKSAMETYWFGYLCVPQWATDKTPRTYPFTEDRTLWIIRWATEKYGADPERVYAGGGSMGAWGSSTFAFRHPELFAAVYPDRPRTRQRGMPSLAKLDKGQKAMMPDGKTEYLDRMDMVEFATEHPKDLPLLGWCCGRHDGFASWKEQIDMVKAMTAAHHGFAFSWNDGDHSSGSAAMRGISTYYPWEKFARDESYPAFGNSSIDNDLGSGELVEKELKDAQGGVRVVKDLKDGDLVGGINLGFDWKNAVDEPGKWSVSLCNVLAEKEMTVDVTPRRCQKFAAKPGDKFKWTSSAGAAGEVVADAAGLVTVEKFKLAPCEKKPAADPKAAPEVTKAWTTLTIEAIK